MQLLLLGKTGQLGWQLQRALAPLGTVVANQASARFNPRLISVDRRRTTLWPEHDSLNTSAA